MGFLDGLSSTVGQLFSSIKEGYESSVDALADFVEKLNEFYEYLDTAADTGFASVANQSAIVKSIGLFRWFCGNTLFNLMYLVTMFGCMYAVYKLVTALWGYFEPWIERFVGSIRGLFLGGM